VHERCGHLHAELVRAAAEDQHHDTAVVNGAHRSIVPDLEHSNAIMTGVTRLWTQNGGPHMGAPWSSIDIAFCRNGKIQLHFSAVAAVANHDEDDDDFVAAVHRARSVLYESLFGGIFPDLITKIMHLSGVWGMGGLVDLPAPQIGSNYHVHSSFGLTNPDMPCGIVAQNAHPGNSSDNNNSTRNRTTYSALLVPKDNPPLPRVGMAGYGYEFLIVTRQQQDWTKYLMQWAVDMELQKDTNFLAYMEMAGGLTVERVPVGPRKQQVAQVLIAPAQDPWPSCDRIVLPNGTLKFLIITTITKDELKFAMKNGRPALLKRLRDEGIGQFSDLDRLGDLEEDQSLLETICGQRVCAVLLLSALLVLFVCWELY
jgi:Suppressor of fused protein (SUFU)